MKSLDVLGKRVPLKKVKNLTRETGMLAYYDTEAKIIAYDSELSQERFLPTLIHEMVHAIFDRSGLSQAKLPLELEEVIAEVFQTVLLENFKVTPR